MTLMLTRNDIAGCHRWGSCNRNSIHGYLADRHRHLFTIECEFHVSGEDREKEIFASEDTIDAFIHGSYMTRGNLVDFGERSCETIAREICIGVGAASCTVREDGRGGARYVRE